MTKCKSCGCELSDAFPESKNDWHRDNEGNTSKVCACGCQTPISGHDICEWCGMRYPKGGYLYWEIQVFDDKHKICDDCKKHLKRSPPSAGKKTEG